MKATGADYGEVDGSTEPYAFSIPLDVALGSGTVVAWTMNGDSLPPDHGFPLRLVVGGSYGMASVKWLTVLETSKEPFDGHFIGHYRYQDDSAGRSGRVGSMLVRALISHPAEGDELSGDLDIRGSAWSGSAPIVGVEVSSDGGSSWVEVELETPPGPYSATIWALRWTPPGPGRYQLAARATDATGNLQPADPTWNALGYGNNSYHRVTVEVIP